MVSWLFAALVIILIITAVAHYLNGGIRLQTPGQRVTPQVKAHLSVLLGVLALIKAAGYWLQRYELTCRPGARSTARATPTSTRSCPPSTCCC